MNDWLNKICLMFVVFITPFLFGEDSGVDFVKSLQNHANQLVRENNFEGSQYFFEKAFKVVDSLKRVGLQETEVLDSLELALIQHYENFNDLLYRLNHNLYEDRVFYFHKDIIDRNVDESLREGIDFFPDVDNKRVRKFLKYYTGRARRSTQVYLERAGFYLSDIRKVFRIYGIAEELAYLPMVESGFNPFAHSYAGASGLWQFVKSTGEFFGLENNWWVDDRKSLLKSTVAAAEFLKLLYQDYGDWNLVLAAYNCGQGGLNRRIRSHKSRNFWSLYRLPKQTKEYVPRFIALSKIADNPEKYGFDVLKKERVLCDTVQLDSCFNIAAIAVGAKSSYAEIKKLNPQIRQWCLPPYADAYPVLIPAEGKLGFRERIAQLSDSQLYSTQSYTVKKGDSLKKIAKKFKIDVSGIKDLNAPAEVSSLIAGAELRVAVPPLKAKWFTEFNNKYLSYYDGEEYYLDGRNKIKYRVRKGDSVWKIARKFNVSRNRLKGWNKIGRENKIFPGQHLVIYL